MVRAQELSHWLSSLEPAAREAVMARAHMLALPPHTKIYAQGDPADGIYIVLEGAVKELAADEGCLRLVRLAGPGSVLGAGELFSEPVQTMSAVTLRPTRLALLRQPDLHEIFVEHPSTLLWVMQQLSDQLKDLRRALVETVYVESAARLARKLVEVAERFGERTPHRCAHPHQTLARRVGSVGGHGPGDGQPGLARLRTPRLDRPRRTTDSAFRRREALFDIAQPVA
jgi:CRP-like cAMP-binding protein